MQTIAQTLRSLTTLGSSLCVAAMILTSAPQPAQAQGSQASELSLLPVAVSGIAAYEILGSGGQLVVASVSATAAGSAWVVERLSDGARVTLQVARGASVAAGTTLSTVAISTGMVLMSAGVAVAYLPSAAAAALLHNERITQ
jgi:hypothetical protein